MDRATRLKRLGFRAAHRGTREADMVLGGFFDAHHSNWVDDDICWFEILMDEQDVDILAWALRAQPVPPRWQGPMMDALMKLDFVTLPE